MKISNFFLLGRKPYKILKRICCNHSHYSIELTASTRRTQIARMSLLHDGLPHSGYQFSKAFSSKATLKQLGPDDIKVTLNDLKLELARDMGVDHPWKPKLENREELVWLLPKSQEELPPRSMQDSFIAAKIPLSTDVALQEKYTTFLGSVRLGRLIEDMDIFTVIVARKHISNPNLPKDAKFPQTLVTVLVDRIDFTDYAPKVNKDLKISGHVSWVGKTSLEVVVWLEQFSDTDWKRITRALFLVAARDPTNKYATFVNSLKPADDREKDIFGGGESRRKARSVGAKDHVSKTLPTVEEQKLIHNIYTRTTDPKDISTVHQILPPKSAWMSNSKISSVILAFPEDRNLHNTVFGGFIMRQATELSWILACIYCKKRPRTRSLSDVAFKAPIAVHSLIRMHATVVYTHKNFIQNLVFAEVFDPLIGETSTTNTFHITLEAPEIVPEVLPLTYQESMLYIDGARHFHKWDGANPTKDLAKSKL